MKDKLLTLAEAADLITAGKLLVISGEENVLTQLPKGNWVGGSMPYFYLKSTKGVMDHKHVYVTDFTPYATNFKIKTYTTSDIADIAVNGYGNGFQFLILPAGQEILKSFALNSDTYENLYENPLIGIIAGVSLDDLAKGRASKTFNGQTGENFESSGVALHVEIAKDKVARLETLNVFEPDLENVELEFEETTFKVIDCLIDGQKQNLYDYLVAKEVDIKLPLIVNYAGSDINVSFESLDKDTRSVNFYAPLFKGSKYSFSKPIADYSKAFTARVGQLKDKDNMIFNCNCILNYLYGDLENNDIGFSGASTFGEIAYNLLNQTFTYLVLDE